MSITKYLDHGLVKLTELDSDFLIELRYATENNFTGQIIYDFQDCYLYRKTALLLVKAKDKFKAQGYRVKIWDAYRPHRAQKKLWQVYPDDNFVARAPDLNTAYRIRPSHMNGMSVDLTLIDEKGKELPMPTGFDEFTPDANPLKSRASRERVDNALYLRQIMLETGFTPSNTEWWHFNDGVHKARPFSDIYF